MEDKHGHIDQMEFITNYVQNTKVELKGDNLIGDIDFMHSDTLELYPTDPELKCVMVVKTAIVTADTSGSTVEAETDLVINVYNYEQNLDIAKIYGLFCYATIFNYMTITNAMRGKEIKCNDDLYKPTIIVPSLHIMEKQIIGEMKRAYGDF